MQATSAPGSSAGAFVDKTDLTAGTKWTAADANAWQAELLHIITEAGLTPSGGDLEQVRKAVQALAKLVKVDEATDSDTIGGVGITTIGDGIKAKHGYLHGNSVQQNTIFDALSLAIPNTNDWAPISGSIVDASGVSIISLTHAFKVSSSIIGLYGTFFIPSVTGQVFNTQVNDGSTAAMIISIAW